MPTTTDMVIEELCGSDVLAGFSRSVGPKLDLETLGLPDLTDCEQGDYCGIFVLRRGESVLALAPRLRRRTELPIRIGEKVLARLPLQSLIFLPPAQESFSQDSDAMAFLVWMRRSRPRFALFFPDLFIDTPLARAVLANREFGYRSTVAAPAKHLFHKFESSYEDFFEQKRSKYKNQLRKNEKVFCDRFGLEFAFIEYRTPDAVEDFLSAADLINKKTYQYRLFGESVNNDTSAKEHYRAVARRGHFRSFVLWQQDVPLCFVLGEQRPDGIYRHTMTGFDPDWREFAPGINCNIMLLKHLYKHERPLRVDFGSGDSDYKRLFSNETRYSFSPTLLPDSLAHSAAYGLYTFSVLANTAAVNLLDRWGLKNRIKRFLRKRPGSERRS